MPSERATERKLIFINLLNGVSPEQVARDFHKNTIAEIMEDFRFVALKLKSYGFQRAMPYIHCDTIDEARQSKLTLLVLLEKVNLDVVSVFSSIKPKPIESIL